MWLTRRGPCKTLRYVKVGEAQRKRHVSKEACLERDGWREMHGKEKK
jgi:hypothetical protein